MNVKTTRFLALSIPIAFLLIGFARPTAAVKPEVTEISIEYEEGVFIDCNAVKPEWTFQIAWSGSEHSQITTYFDNNGEMDRMTVSIHYQGIAWNTVSGLSVKDYSDWRETYYPATNTWAVSGHIYHWVVNGQGPVLVETGHSVWYWDGTVWLALKEHGSPHDLTSVYWLDITPMCTALA